MRKTRAPRVTEKSANSPSAPASAADKSPLAPLLACANRIGRYQEDGASGREILRVEQADGGTLVLDCLAGTITDARLLAHLTAEEPVENAWIIAQMYLGDENRGRCRRVSAEELLSGTPADPGAGSEADVALPSSLLDNHGHSYAISRLATSAQHVELRWVLGAHSAAFEPVTFRAVVAAMEDYEPARSMTFRALAGDRAEVRVSTRRLSEEVLRVTSSPIVLNRVLRERVRRALADGASMSEIAMRCGRYKRDRRGKLSGETSWLARRIGAMAEAGGSEPTVWIHTNSLALIARHGLGLNPNEVEV